MKKILVGFILVFLLTLTFVKIAFWGQESTNFSSGKNQGKNFPTEGANFKKSEKDLEKIVSSGAQTQFSLKIDFLVRISGFESSLEGREQTNAITNLLFQAKEALNLEEFHEVCDSVENLNAWQDGYYLLGEKYGETNAKLGYEWLQNISHDPMSAQAFQGFASTLNESELDHCLEFASEIGSKKLRNSLITGLLNRQYPNDSLDSRRNTAEKIIKFSNLPDNEVNFHTLSRFTAQFLEIEEYDVALSLTSQIESAQPRDAALRAIFNTLADRSPEQATAAISTLERESDRVVAVKSLAPLWIRQDPKGASDWALSLNDSLRDHASASIAEALRQLNPTDALQWAESIDNENLRKRSIQELQPYLNSY